MEDFIFEDDNNLDFIDQTEEDIFGVEPKGLKTKSEKKADPNVLRKIKEKMKQDVKNQLKEWIKPINAETIKNFIPEKNENIFFLMNGNCQFIDYIYYFVKEIKQVDEIYLTTLSVNNHTFESLDKILPNIKKNILISSYFLATDRSQTLQKLKKANKLKNYEIGFFRNHTKMVLIKSKDNYFLFTGSANLRSSGTIEQFSIYNSKKLFEFNKSWISKLIDKYNFKKEFKNIKNTGQASFYFMLDFEN